MPQKKNNSNNSEKPQNAYFLSLELENVRCFGEKQKIDFSDGNGKPKQWIIILGDNGTGKTTLLQNLVAIIPSVDKYKGEETIPTAFDYSPFWQNFIFEAIPKKEAGKTSIVRANFTKQKLLLREEKEQFVEVALRGNWTIREVLGSFHNITLICLAYGASRKAGKTSISEQKERNSYITLFDETVLLINPEEWLLQADYASKRESKFQEKRKQQLEMVKNILIKILPHIDNIRFGEKGRENKSISTPIVEFQTPYGWVEAKDLSLGYRTSMAWVIDFASRMFDLYPESENPLAEPAVVLIDEIDLHLHPKWQRELLDYLSNLFPNTQFIVTTHSPLIVQSAAARDANIVVCRREGDHVVIDQSVEAVKNWRADQILTSDLFGLESARPKEIEKELFERQEILSKAKLTKKDEKRLKELEEKIGAVPVMENPKYDEAMDIIFRAAEKLEKTNGSSK